MTYWGIINDNGSLIFSSDTGRLQVFASKKEAERFLKIPERKKSLKQQKKKRKLIEVKIVEAGHIHEFLIPIKVRI